MQWQCMAKRMAKCGKVCLKSCNCIQITQHHPHQLASNDRLYMCRVSNVKRMMSVCLSRAADDCNCKTISRDCDNAGDDARCSPHLHPSHVLDRDAAWSQAQAGRAT